MTKDDSSGIINEFDEDMKKGDSKVLMSETTFFGDPYSHLLYLYGAVLTSIKIA